jgi:hypothetical protein
MSEKNIWFTYLETVIINKTELTNKDFVNRMTKLIMNDSDKYNVHYDSKKKCYVIIYDGEEYIVKYRNKELNNDCNNKSVLCYIKQLVDISELQKELNNESTRRKKELETAKEKKLKEKQDETIGNTIDKLSKDIKEKEEEINELKKDFFCKENSLVCCVKDLFKLLNYGKVSKIARFFRGMAGIFALGMLSQMIGVVGFNVGIFIYLLLGYSALEGLSSIFFVKSDGGQLTGYRGILVSLLSIPVILGYSVVHSVLWSLVGINTFLNITKLKNEIGNIRRNFNRIKVKNKNLEKINLDFLNEKDIKIDQKRIVMTVNEANELKDKILSIKDKKTKKELAKELYKIIEDSLNMTKIYGHKRDNGFDILTNNVTILKNKVDKVLEKENNENNEEKVLYRLMTEVDNKKEEVNKEEYMPVKAIGVRK